MTTPGPAEHGGLRRILLAPLRGLVGALVLLDELARPLYRPLIAWFAGLSLVAKAEAAIARLPRPAILGLLAVPFAVAEPAKIVGVVMIGQGRVRTGLAILAIAYLASFILVERIYHAGRPKLLTYRWLAWAMGLLATIRARLLDWVRASRAYVAARALTARVRRWWRA